MDQFKVIREQDYMQQEKGTGAVDKEKKIDVALQEYRDMHARYSQQEHQDKVLAQPRIVRRFYDAVTGFYEFGWGSSFHFAPRVNGKNLATCQHRLQEDGDSRHKDIRNRIEYANATPDLPTTQYQADSIKSVGFEILGADDYALKSDPGTPWYISLEGRDFSFSSFARTPFGREFTAFVTKYIANLSTSVSKRLVSAISAGIGHQDLARKRS